jgi:hypothetical protein
MEDTKKFEIHSLFFVEFHYGLDKGTGLLCVDCCIYLHATRNTVSRESFLSVRGVRVDCFLSDWVLEFLNNVLNCY